VLHIRSRIIATKLIVVTTSFYLKDGVSNVIGFDNEPWSQQIYSLYAKAVYYYYRFFIKGRVFLFNIIQLLTLKNNQMSLFYQHSPNGLKASTWTSNGFSKSSIPKTEVDATVVFSFSKVSW
jgi:hypothetical protein